MTTPLTQYFDLVYLVISLLEVHTKPKLVVKRLPILTTFLRYLLHKLNSIAAFHVLKCDA